jgi:hypothetical protein
MLRLLPQHPALPLFPTPLLPCHLPSLEKYKSLCHNECVAHPARTRLDNLRHTYTACHAQGGAGPWRLHPAAADAGA